jgi:hypothetical protein
MLLGGVLIGMPFCWRIGVSERQEKVMSYNGWTNRATWAWQLHMTNDQGLHDETRMQVLAALIDEGEHYQEYGWCRPASEVVVKALKNGFWYWSDMHGDGQFPWMASILKDVGDPFDIDWDDIAPHWYGPDWDHDSQYLFDAYGWWVA